MAVTLKQKRLAKDVFKSLCELFDENKFKYTKDKDRLCVDLVMQGDDIPIGLSIIVSAELQVALLVSHLPFIVPHDRRAAMAVAANEANSYMIDGSFEMNYLTGEVNFRMTAHFENSMISKDLLRYFVFTACKTIDMYNDKFLFVTKNDMTAEQVIEYLH